MKQLPSEFRCPICKTHIKLEESERNKRMYRCKSCEKVVDLTSTKLLEEKPLLYKPVFNTLILSVIPFLLCFLGYKLLHNHLNDSWKKEMYSSKQFKELLDNVENIDMRDIEKKTERIMLPLKKEWNKKNAALIFLDKYFIIPIFIFIVTFLILNFVYKKFDRPIS